MSETGGSPSGSETPKQASKLDTLSRDDLVRFLKKQQLSVKEGRQKCVDLENVNSKLNLELTDLRNEICQLKSERDVAFRDHKEQVRSLTEKLDSVQRQDVAVVEGQSDNGWGEADWGIPEEHEQSDRKEVLSSKTSVNFGQNTDFSESEKASDCIECKAKLIVIDELSAQLSTRKRESCDFSDRLKEMTSNIEELNLANSRLNERLSSYAEVEAQRRSSGPSPNSTGASSPIGTTAIDVETTTVTVSLVSQFVQTDSLEQSQSSDQQESALLSLEIAEYERSIERLQVRLTEAEQDTVHWQEAVKKGEGDRQKLFDEIETANQDLRKAQEQITSHEADLVDARTEIADLKTHIQNSTSTSEEFQGKLDEKLRQIDNLKIELATAQSTIAQYEEQNKVAVQEKTDELDNIRRQLNEAKSELRRSEQARETLGEEHSVYKARVQSVLRQQTSSSHEDESWIVEKQHLTKTAEQLQQKINDTVSQLNKIREECEELETERDRVLQRMQTAQMQYEAKVRACEAKIEQLQTEAVASGSKHSLVVQQLTAQNEELRSGFQERIKEMQREHTTQVQTYAERIHSLESDVSGLRQQVSTLREAAKPAADASDIPAAPTMRTASRAPRPPLRIDTSLAQSLDIPESGGGVAPFESASNISDPMSPEAVPFDVLLEQKSQHSEVRSHSLQASDTVIQEHVAQMKGQLDSSSKRIEHMNEVLNESEATNARLAEQTKLLKEEIRRLQRNDERTKHVENSEYLKNVIIKFLTLPPGSERTQLIPVLQTMLRLSADEITTLKGIADSEAMAVAGSSAWSGYLHRWTGLSS